MDTAADLAVGIVFIACGAVAFTRVRRTGLLMAATGAAWLLGSAAGALVFLHRGPLVHLLVSYPSGRVRTRAEWAVIAAAYVTGVTYPLGSVEPVTIALLVGLVAVAGIRHKRAGGALQRPTGAALVAAVAVAAVLAVATIERLAGAEGSDAILWAYEIVLLLLAVGLCADLVRGRWTEAAITGLVVDLGEIEREASLRARLARSVGDPSLELGFWRAELGRYEDEAGRVLAIPGPGSGRKVLSVDDGDEQLAAIVHDPSVIGEPELAAAVTTAVRIAVANLRLQDDVRDSVVEIRESRRRLVEAAAAERQRLEGELQAEAAPRLERVEGLLGGDDPLARELADELRASRAELLELARGIHPRALTESGLAVALDELAARSALPLELDIAVDALSPTLASAAYFVCSEGLANAAKHAEATRVRIVVRSEDAGLRLELSDNGVGGADPSGTGLVGLADRVEALGGVLCVHSSVGVGTTLVAELPLGAADLASERDPLARVGP